MAEEKPANGKTAALLIAHGSRLEAANRDLVTLAEQLRSRRAGELESRQNRINRPAKKKRLGAFG